MLEKLTTTRGLLAIAGVVLVIFALVFAGSGDKPADTTKIPTDTMTQDFPKISTENPLVMLKTSKGDIILELYMDRTPVTAGNFLKLAEQNFYDGTKFHRVISNFMIQGGDPESKGTDVSRYGRGGPGYTIEDEFDPELSNLRGTIAMANTGEPNSGGSQFFINVVPNVQLDFDKQPFTSKHPVFGHVISGMDVVDAIAAVETTGPPADRPLEPVTIDDVLVSWPEETAGGNASGTVEEGTIDTDSMQDTVDDEGSPLQ